MFDGDDQYALFLSFLAGLATSVGGIIAVMKKPDQKMLAFLLGTAIGVMATLSLVELYVKNLLQNGFVEVTVAMCIGAVVYLVLEPLLPKTESLEAKVEKQGSGGDDAPTRMSKARLIRLGILMAITMTLHNLPEGFAVAFSSFTGIGPVMAAAIGVHNVPEASIRSSNFRPLHKKLFWLFVADCLLLGWIGCQPVEDPYVLIGQLASVYFFAYFLIFIPFLGKFEKALLHYVPRD